MSDQPATAPAERRRPGRPRSAESHQAILRSTMELLLSEGLRGLSIEGVAQRAGVGKATIYRRWRSKEELVGEAVSNLHATLPVPDTGSARGDFLELARWLVEAAEARGGGADVLSQLVSEAAHDERLHEIFTANLVEPRRAVVRTILARGIGRGEIRGDVDMELMIDMLVGPNTYRALISRAELRSIYERAGRVFDVLYEGIAARG